MGGLRVHANDSGAWQVVFVHVPATVAGSLKQHYLQNTMHFTTSVALERLALPECLIEMRVFAYSFRFLLLLQYRTFAGDRELGRGITTARTSIPESKAE